MSAPRSTSASSWVVAGSLVVAATAACAAMAICAAARQAANLRTAEEGEGTPVRRLEQPGRTGTTRLARVDREASIASARAAPETQRAALVVVAVRAPYSRLSDALALDAESGRVASPGLGLPRSVGQPSDALERLLSTLASSDGLQRLEIWGVDPALPQHDVFLLRLVQSLATNRGLLHLVMRFDDSLQSLMGPWRGTSAIQMRFEAQRLARTPFWLDSPFYRRRQTFLLNHQLWRLLWEAVSTHPTLRVVDISEYENSFATAYEREFRDRCIVRALATNHVLTDVVGAEHDHDVVLMQTQIHPALELNRFRSIVNHVSDRRVRRHLLALAVAHPRAARYSAVRSFVVLALLSELESPEPANEQALVA